MSIKDDGLSNNKFDLLVKRYLVFLNYNGNGGLGLFNDSFFVNR